MGIEKFLCLRDVAVGVLLQVHYQTGIRQLQSSFYQPRRTREETGFKEQGGSDISKTRLILLF